jgi:hypothetical protein
MKVDVKAELVKAILAATDLQKRGDQLQKKLESNLAVQKYLTDLWLGESGNLAEAIKANHEGILTELQNGDLENGASDDV